MSDKKGIDVLLSKVPDLKKPARVFLTVLYVLCLGALCGLFFFYADRLVWDAPMLSQLAMALVVTGISYLHFRVVEGYREKHGPLAYRYCFYHLMVPYLVTWYACFFHPGIGLPSPI